MNTNRYQRIPDKKPYTKSDMEYQDWLDRRHEDAKDAYGEETIPNTSTNCCEERVRRNGLCSECGEHCDYETLEE